MTRPVQSAIPTTLQSFLSGSAAEPAVPSAHAADPSDSTDAEEFPPFSSETKRTVAGFVVGTVAGLLLGKYLRS